MTQAVAYEDAVDLLDADHKAVKALFIKFNGLCDDDAPAQEKQQVADKICQALTVHAQIEEEIFYPQVREATGDDALLDEALQEHAQAKAAIAEIQGMTAGDDGFDDKVKELGKAIDAHVLEEREQIFLDARYAALDLRGMAVDLFARKKQLMQPAPKAGKSAGKKKVAA
jgi:hemerythrin superfamily protein